MGKEQIYAQALENSRKYHENPEGLVTFEAQTNIDKIIIRQLNTIIGLLILLNKN